VTFPESDVGEQAKASYQDALSSGLLRAQDIPEIRDKRIKTETRVNPKRLEKLINQRQKARDADAKAREDRVNAETERRKTAKRKERDAARKLKDLNDNIARVLEQDKQQAKAEPKAKAEQANGRTNALLEDETVTSMLSEMAPDERAVFLQAMSGSVMEIMEGAGMDTLLEGVSEIAAGLAQKVRGKLTLDEQQLADELAKTFAGHDEPGVMATHKGLMRVLEARKGAPAKPKAMPELPEGMLPDGSGYDGFTAAKAAVAKPGEIVRFRAKGNHTLKGQPVLSKGEYGWFESNSGRIYRTREEALAAQPKAMRPKVEPGDIVERYKAALAKGDLASAAAQLHDDLLAITGRSLPDPGTKAPPAKATPKPEPTPKPIDKATLREQWAKLPPREGFVPALLSAPGAKGRHGAKHIRVATTRQIAAGKTRHLDILGEKGDPSEWVPGYVPEKLARATDAERKTLAVREFIAAGADPVKKLELVKAEDMGRFKLTAEQNDRLKAAGVPGIETLTDVSRASLELEAATWAAINGRNLGAVDQHIEKLRALYRIEQEIAPDGILKTPGDRAQSIKTLEDLFAGQPKSVLDDAVRLLNSLAGGNVPTIRAVRQASGDALASANISADGGEILLRPKLKQHGESPGFQLASVMHEVGHWAYFNILTPGDRLDFWSFVKDAVYTGGKLDQAKLDALLPPHRLGGKSITNAADSPQELFANLWEKYLHNRGDFPTLNDNGFWGRVHRYIKALFDWFTNREPIPTELEQLFSKIIPDEAERSRAAAGGSVDYAGLSDLSKTILVRAREMDFIDTEIRAALDGGNDEQVIEAAKSLLSHLYARAPRFRTKGGGIVRPSKKTFAPLQRGDIPDRIVAIQDKLSGIFRDVANIETYHKPMSAPGDDRPLRDHLLDGLTSLLDGEEMTDEAIYSVLDPLPEQLQQFVQLYTSGQRKTDQVRELILNRATDRYAALFREDETGTDPGAVFIHQGDEQIGSVKQGTELANALRQALNGEIEGGNLGDITSDIRAYYKEAIQRIEGGDDALKIPEVPDSLRAAQPLSEENRIKLARNIRLSKASANRATRTKAEVYDEAAKLVADPGVKRQFETAAALERAHEAKWAVLDADTLIERYAALKGDAGSEMERAAIAKHIVTKRNSLIPKPEQPPSKAKAQRLIEQYGATNTKLRSAIKTALDAGDADTARDILYVLDARKNLRGGIVLHSVVEHVDAELAHRGGPEAENGIPNKAPLAVKDILRGFGSRRRPDLERATRTIAYRLLMLNRDKTVPGLVFNEDIHRLMGQELTGPKTVITDYDDPAYLGFKKKLSAIARNLNTKNGDRNQALLDLGQLITNSRALTDDDLALIGKLRERDTDPRLEGLSDAQWLAERWVQSAYNRPLIEGREMFNVTISPEQKARLSRVVPGLDQLADNDGNIDVAQLDDIAVRAELTHWSELGNKASFNSARAALGELYAALKEIAPHGFIRNTTTKTAAIAEAQAIFQSHGYSESTLKAVIGVINGLNAPEGAFPKLEEGGIGTFGNFGPDPTDNLVEINTGLIGEGLAGAGDEGGQVGHVLVHELGHWAYFNLLGYDDRLAFFDWIGKHAFDGDKLDGSKLVRYLEPTGLTSWKRAAAQGETAGVMQSNAAENPQELFANLFTSYVMRRMQGQDTQGLADTSLWNRAARYIKTLYDWLVGGQTVPKDLEPIFQKILPDGETPRPRSGEVAEGYGLGRNAIISEDTFGELAAPGRALIDKLSETAAYALNGQVAREDVRSDFMRLFLYGDMFERGGALVPNTKRIIPGMEGRFEAQFYSSIDAKTEKAIRAWTGGGLGEAADGSPIVYYSNGDGLIAPSVEQLGRLKLEDSPEIQALRHEAREQYAMAAAERKLKQPNLDVADKYTRQGDELTQRADELQAALAENASDAAEPVLVSATNAVDFSGRRYYDATKDINGFLDELMEPLTETLEEVIGLDTLEAIELIDGTVDDLTDPSTNLVNGRELRNRLANLLDPEGGEAGRERLNTILGDLGYEAVIQERGIQLIDHIDSTGQRKTANDLLKSAVDPVFAVEEPLPKTVNPAAGRTSGIVLQSVLHNPDGPTEQVYREAMHTISKFVDDGDEVNRAAGPMLKMATGKEPTSADLQEVKRASFATQAVASLPKRMRQYGMNWLADYTETYMPSTHRRFMAHWAPISDALAALEPEQSRISRGVKKWGQRIARPLKITTQPDSHARIIAALRHDPSSPAGQRKVKALRPKERSAYTLIRQHFDNALQEMRESGMLVGEIKNYFPQIWDIDAIQHSPEAFQLRMKDFLLREWKREGVMQDRTPDEQVQQAYRRAKHIMARLIDDEGVFLPTRYQNQSGGSSAGHLDYQRMIRLQNDPEMLDLFAGGDGRPQFLAADLETNLSKYFDQVARRVAETDRIGFRGFALNDYLKVQYEGRSGVRDLLSSDRVFKINHQMYGMDGFIETSQDGLSIPMPLQNPQADANAIIDGLYDAIEINRGKANAKAGVAYLEGLVDKTRWPEFSARNYTKRAEAIVHALIDTQGGKSRPHQEGFKDATRGLLAIQGRLNSGSKEYRVKGSRAIRAFNSISLLSFATLSSLPDLILPTVKTGDIGASIRGLRKYITNPHYRDQIRRTGIAVESVLNSRMQGLYAGDVGGWSGRLQQSFFQANLLSPWTDLMRELSGAVGLEAFEAQARIASNALKLDPGGDPLPAAQQSPDWKRAYRILRSYGLEDFATGASKQLDPADPLVAEALIRFSNDTVFAPGPAETPLWAQTPSGALAWQLKSFPTMMQRFTFGTDEKGGLATNFTRYLRGQEGYTIKDAMPALMVLSASPAFGALSLISKDALLGRGEANDEGTVRDRHVSKTWLGDLLGLDEAEGDDLLGWYIESMMMAGGLGFMAELFQDVASQSDNDLYGFYRTSSALMGPWFGTGFDAWNVAAGELEEIKKELGTSKTGGVGKERRGMRSLIARTPLVGSHYGVREAFVDQFAGEAKKRGGGSGGGSSSGPSKSDLDRALEAIYAAGF